jgi:hypothetical protein
MLNAGSDDELDTAFATLDRQPIEALVVVTSPFFVTRARQIVALVDLVTLGAFDPVVLPFEGDALLIACDQAFPETAACSPTDPTR